MSKAREEHLSDLTPAERLHEDGLESKKLVDFRRARLDAEDETIETLEAGARIYDDIVRDAKNSDLLIVAYFAVSKEYPDAIAYAVYFKDQKEWIEQQARVALAEARKNRPDLRNRKIIKKEIVLWGNYIRTMQTGRLMPKRK